MGAVEAMGQCKAWVGSVGSPWVWEGSVGHPWVWGAGGTPGCGAAPPRLQVPTGGAELPTGTGTALQPGHPSVPPVAGSSPGLGTQLWGPP